MILERRSQAEGLELKELSHNEAREGYRNKMVDL